MERPTLLSMPLISLSIITSSTIFFFIIIIVVVSSPTSYGADDDQFTTCSQLYDCGEMKGIGYPFWWGDGRPSFCGVQGFELRCNENEYPTIAIDNQRFRVLHIDESARNMTIARIEMWDNICPNEFSDTTLNFYLFDYGPYPHVVNISLFYDCSFSPTMPDVPVRIFPCPVNDNMPQGHTNISFFLEYGQLPLSNHPQCESSIKVPVFEQALKEFWSNESMSVQQLVKEGFGVEYHEMEYFKVCEVCNASGGICGTNISTNQLTCFCPSGGCPNQGVHLRCEVCNASGGICGTNSTNQPTCFCPSGGCPNQGVYLPCDEVCNASGGICWTSSTNQPTCFCPSGGCPNQGNGRRMKFYIGFGAAGGTVLVAALVLFVYHRCNKKHNATSSWISRITSSYTSSMTDFEKDAINYGVQTFSYNELEKATNNFDSRNEVGDGGFGTVYQGKLRDGRVVAVKRLYEHNYKRVEQFMNEVEILTRLRHQNLVSLYGCTSRHCRELLLVYEYIPNGTVADHLHGDRAKPGSLSWTTRMNIATETANALAYLHASDVIHRDVKTNNILLDNNFCVKVADFGLSRLFPTDVTHVSTAPQGTPGYVDPEYHECYQLTDKSDVYSFGVVLIELISSKPAVDITRHRHEINLSNMAINKIQNHELHELVDPFLGFQSDYKVKEMITAVAELAFQCLQSERDMRPSMDEVLEVLKGIGSEDAKMAEEVDIPEDDVVLLKSDPPTLSSDSLMKN